VAIYPRPPSYGIFVKFRRSRLALRRGIVTLEEALSLAEQIRESRFHDRGDVFVVKEPEDVTVDAEWLRPRTVADAVQVAQVAGTGLGRVNSPIGGTAPRASSPAPAAPSPSPPQRYPLPLDSLLRLSAQVDRMGRAVDRARAAQARFDSACLTAGDTLSRWEKAPGAGGGPIAGLRQSVDRALALRGSAARSIASFESASLLFRRRVEAVWVESTGQPAPPR
jgi:hypothetical protein